MNNVPNDLKENIEKLGGDRGSKWLDALPQMLLELAESWHIRKIVPCQKQSYNFTAACILNDGREAFLKIGFPSPEEIIAKQFAMLRLYGHNLAPEVYAHDPERDALLLEKLEPGTTLYLECKEDPARAVQVAIDLLGRIPRIVPQNAGIPSLEKWFEVYQADTSRLLPGDVLERGKELIGELDVAGDVLLHGDFHHGNVLRSGDAFKVIDPEGARGSIAYEAAVFLNEHHRLYFERTDIREQVILAADSFAGELGITRKRMLEWAFCQSVQCMAWDAEDFGEYNEIDIAVARRWLQMISP